jgi:hypothetical protein
MPLEPVNMTEEEAVTLALSHFRRPKDPRPCEHADCPHMTISGYDFCEEHASHYHCEECDRRLEDAYGQPGDGICRRCD